MVNIDGNRCIQLDVKTDVTRLKVPEEMEGEYEATMTGQSRYFFNVERRVFQKGKQALLMTMHIDAPTPDINKKNIPDGQSADIPSRMQMKMSNDNLFELNLRK